jgi:hypothetical protein
MKLETQNQDITRLLNFKYVLCENKSKNPLKPFNYLLYGGTDDEKVINDVLKENKALYEYIRENVKVKPYIDFEIEDETRFKYYNDDELNKLKTIKKTILKKLVIIFKLTLFKLGCNIDYTNILILDGSRVYTKGLNNFYKISFHLTINLYYVFNTQEHAKNILLNTFLNTEKETYNTSYLYKHIDSRVYGKTQRMRTINSNKTAYDTERLKPVNIECELLKVDEPINYLITYFNDDYIIINNGVNEETFNKIEEKGKDPSTRDKKAPQKNNKYTNDIQKLLFKKGMKTATIPEIVNNTFYKILYNPNHDVCVYGNKTHNRVMFNNPICYAYIHNGTVYAGCWGEECRKKPKIKLGCILERSPLEDDYKTLRIKAPILGLNDEVKATYNKFINNDDLRALCVKSSYGTGKTYILNEYVNKYILKLEKEQKRKARVLVLSTRQSYARSMCSHSMKDIKINNYLDFTKEEKEHINKLNRLCVSLEGLYNMMFERWKPYDIIIIDESESVCRHIFSTTIKQGAYATYERIKLLMSKSKKIFMMDADLTCPSLNLIGQFKENQIININNTYTNEGRTYTTTYNKKGFIDDIKTNIINNQNVYIVCLSATEAINLYNELEPLIKTFNKTIQTYYGEAGDNIKEELKEVNNNWSLYNVVITTSTTGAGIDYNIKNHFHKIYGYITAGCACPSEFLQILNRVRHPINNNINLLLDSKLKLPKNILELYEENEQYIYTVNNAKYILDELNKHIINDEVYYTYEDDEGFINNKKEYKERDYNFSMLTYYNYLTTNLNNTGAVYTLILQLLIEQQNNIIIFDPEKIKQQKGENHRLKKLQNVKIANMTIYETETILTKHQKTENEKLILTKNKIKSELKVKHHNADNEDNKKLIEIMYKTSKHAVIKNLKECYIKPEFKETLRTEKEYTDETQRIKDLKLTLFRKVLKLLNYEYTQEYIINNEIMNGAINKFTITSQEARVISRSKLGAYEYMRATLNKYGFNLIKVLDRKTINGEKITAGVKHYIIKPNEDLFNVFNLIVNNNNYYDETIKSLCSNYNKYIHLQQNKKLF